jgi:hypothetical protein
MVDMGRCDTCDEYCGSLGVTAVEDIMSADDEDELLDPDDLAEVEDEDEDDREARLEELRDERAQERLEDLASQHTDLVTSRMECAEFDGVEWRAGRHVGPWHDRDGKPLDECPNCSDDTEMDFGEWDSSLDHATCLECWADIAGGGVLRKRRGSSSAVPTPGRVPPIDPHTSTEPADRVRLEAAFAAYLGEPPVFRWVPSPIEVVRALATAPGIDFDNDGPWSVWSADPDLARAFEEGDFPEGLPGLAGGDTIARTLAAGIAERGLDGLERWPRSMASILTDAGQFDRRPALLRALDAAGQPLAADEALVRLLGEACDSAGPLVVLPTEIVVSDRPLVLRLDDRGRPHSDDGPAIAYGDGLVVYAIHGTAIPAWLFEEPERLAPDVIDAEPNVEIRRVMIERFGAERLIREGGAELVHEDETGRLWRRPVGDPQTQRSAGLRGPTRAGRQSDEAIVMVEVRNATPESDGTRKTYFLRVPPTVQTAREAVAWTFDLDGETYRPDVET